MKLVLFLASKAFCRNRTSEREKTPALLGILVVSSGDTLAHRIPQHRLGDSVLGVTFKLLVTLNPNP